jgi:hypothetical protein
MCLQFGFVIFWQKGFGTKAAYKMLVKLTLEEKYQKPYYKLLTKFDSKVQKIFWTEPFSLGQISFHFISLMSKIFFSAQISHLPSLSVISFNT